VSEFKWNAGTLAKVQDKLHIGLIAGLDKAAITLQQEVKRKLNSAGSSNIGSGGKASKAGGPPAKDTGSLGRSIQIDRSGLTSGNSKVRPSVKVGTALPYARHQEFGGTIRAKRVKAMPVPFPGNEVLAKKLRRKAGKSLRNLPKGTLFPMKSKAGNVMLVTRKPNLVSQASVVWSRRGADIKAGHGTVKGAMQSSAPVFLLRKSIRLPARPYMRPAFKATSPKVETIIQSAVDKVIRELSRPSTPAP